MLLSVFKSIFEPSPGSINFCSPTSVTYASDTSIGFVKSRFALSSHVTSAVAVVGSEANAASLEVESKGLRKTPHVQSYLDSARF